jgi:hypothetical protein
MVRYDVMVHSYKMLDEVVQSFTSRQTVRPGQMEELFMH